jgi:hypothetical protein
VVVDNRPGAGGIVGMEIAARAVPDGYTILATATATQVIAPLLLARGSTLLVVGDEPALSALGAFLIGRQTFPPLLHAQVSVIRDRQPAWCLRPGDIGRQLLLVA